MAIDGGALLDNIFNLLGDGEAGVKTLVEKKGKLNKPEKLPLINEEDKYTYRLHEGTLKTKALVLIKHVYQCSCGAEHVTPNVHILCLKEDKYGNRHETRFFTEEDTTYPRITRTNVIEVNTCHVCFETAKIKPVLNSDAKEDIEAVDALVDLEISKLLAKWDGDK